MDQVKLLVIHYVVADVYFSEVYGGDDGAQTELRGVKNPSLLLSALGEPRQTFGGEDLYPDIFTKAAALMRSLCLNHAFHDGNKRTAMMAAIIFLEENGYRVVAPKYKMFRLAMKIVSSKRPTVNKIARTLKKFSRPEPEYKRVWNRLWRRVTARIKYKG